MVVRIGRLLVRWRRVLLEIGEQNFNGFFQLRVMSLPHSFGVELDFHVWGDALILHFPFIVRCPESAARGSHYSAIHQRLEWTEKPYKAAPCSFADQHADFRLTEMPRHRIAARARIFIDDHGL